MSTYNHIASGGVICASEFGATYNESDDEYRLMRLSENTFKSIKKIFEPDFRTDPIFSIRRGMKI